MTDNVAALRDDTANLLRERAEGWLDMASIARSMGNRERAQRFTLRAGECFIAADRVERIGNVHP